MGNINVNRTTNDPDKPLPLEGVRYSMSPSVVWLVAVICIALFVFWLSFIGLATIACSEVYGFCWAYALAFWSGPTIVGLVVLIGLFAAIQYVINMGWIENFGIKIHRRDTRKKSVDRAYDTLLQRAKSESTRGLDTWSPSNSNSSTNTNDALIETDMSDLDLLGLNLTQGFDNANTK